METFNIKVKNIGTITVFASNKNDAIEIVQAYIDKRSLN